VQFDAWWVFRACERDSSIGLAKTIHRRCRRIFDGIQPGFERHVPFHGYDAVTLGTIVNRNADVSPLPTSGWRQGGLQALI
jgi:hypothetical protein